MTRHRSTHRRLDALTDRLHDDQSSITLEDGGRVYVGRYAAIDAALTVLIGRDTLTEADAALYAAMRVSPEDGSMLATLKHHCQDRMRS